MIRFREARRIAVGGDGNDGRTSGTDAYGVQRVKRLHWSMVTRHVALALYRCLFMGLTFFETNTSRFKEMVEVQGGAAKPHWLNGTFGRIAWEPAAVSDSTPRLAWQ